MLYKKNFSEVLKRLTDFYERKDLKKIYAVMNIKNPVLEEYARSTEDGPTEFPDLRERIELWDRICANGVDLEDDSLAICYLSELDEGLYGGLVGGDVSFLNSKDTAWISSMTTPFIENLEDALKLELPKKGNLWLNRYVDQLKIYAEKAKGKFGISHFILIDGLNFLFELRGATNAYYDLMEEPEIAKEVMEFAKKLNFYVQDLYFEKVGLFENGTISNMLGWCPGKIVSESVDPFHLTGSDFFLEHGKAYIEEITSHYDGLAVHIHANGYEHLLDNVSHLKGIKGIYLIDDAYNERAINKIDILHKLRGTTPIIVSINYDEFIRKMKDKTLYGNILYQVMNVPSLKIANELMKEVKGYEGK